MSKTIFIGGRLESKEKGNVVAGANAIKDDTKGKMQNVINKETDDELLRLEQSKQDNLTFDNAPTEDSTNPVTSGGVYTAEKALSDAIEAILLLIPSAATALNKLVDTNTMNSSISTATATFRGTYNAVSDLGLTYQATHAQIEAALDALGLTADNNDYAFVQVPVSDQSQDIAKTERYKNNGTNWQYEYDLNTSGFTSQQWAAINSGITVSLVTKLTDLPTAAALQLALNAKQDTLTFDTEPTALSQNPVTSGGIYTALQAIVTALGGRLDALEGLIPSEAASNNKLTDKAYVDGLIQAITELIPAEATTSNQLADKAYVLASILAATPAFKGQFTTLAELQAVASPKDGDLGIVRTKDSDGMDVFTVYQYLNNAWGVFYSLSYHPQTKPATTGTTGDYPYNGMGRVELAKNMVNTGTELAPVYENQLTQDMFYKGAVGSRVPNTNTIFVIRYDYVLAENITIPDGCVLEFEGGSISANGNNDTISGTNCIIKGGKSILNGVIIGTGVSYYKDVVPTSIFKTWNAKCLKSICNLCVEGGTVLFDADFIYTTDVSVVLSKSFTVDGNGKELFMTTGNRKSICIFEITSSHHFEIKNLSFDGKADDYTTNDYVNCYFIHTDQVENVSIHDCVFHNIMVDWNNSQAGQVIGFIGIERYVKATFNNNRIYDVNAPEGLNLVPQELENYIPTEDASYPGSSYVYQKFVNMEQHLDGLCKTVNRAEVIGNSFKWNYTSSHVNVYFGRVEMRDNVFHTCTGSSVNALCYDSIIDNNTFVAIVRKTSTIDLSEQEAYGYIPCNVTISNNHSGKCGYFVEWYKAKNITIVGNSCDGEQLDENDYSGTFEETAEVLLGGHGENIVVDGNVFKNFNAFVRSGDFKDSVISNNMMDFGSSTYKTIPVVLYNAENLDFCNNTIISLGKDNTALFVSGQNYGFIHLLGVEFSGSTKTNTFGNVSIRNNVFRVPTSATIANVLFIGRYASGRKLPHLSGKVEFVGNVYDQKAYIQIATDNYDTIGVGTPLVYIEKNNMNITGFSTSVEAKCDFYMLENRNVSGGGWDDTENVNGNIPVHYSGAYIPKGEGVYLTSNKLKLEKPNKNIALCDDAFVAGASWNVGWYIRHNGYMYISLQEMHDVADFIDAQYIAELGLIRVGLAVSTSDVTVWKPCELCYFDVTANKPLYWNGTVWVDATGTPV